MNIRDEVIEMCQGVGLEVHGNMVYGPLDSIAILLELAFEDHHECSEDLVLSVLAQSIANTPL